MAERPYLMYEEPDEAHLEQLAAKAVAEYNNNPHAFSEEQGSQLAYMAANLGLDFKPESKALKKFFFNLVNSATLGAARGLGFEGPKETGEEYGFGTTGGQAAGIAGSVAGFAAGPLALGGKIAKGALGAAAKYGPKAATTAVKGSPRLESAVRGAATGGAAFGVSQALEDPSTIPSNVAVGATLGGLIGSFGKFNRPEAMESGAKYGNEIPLLPAGPVGTIGKRSQLGSQSPTGAPIGMGGQPQLRLPQSSEVPDKEAILNAIRNLAGQQRHATKAVNNRLKAQDNMVLFKGNPVDDMAYNRIPQYTQLPSTSGYTTSGYGGTGYGGTGYGSSGYGQPAGQLNFGF